MPPMSWDQVKCSEGLFEALPQSMLQCYVVFNDLFHSRHVTMIQGLSLLTSYANVGFVLGMMGPPDISLIWRGVFMTFVVVNVLLRSLALSFVTIIDNDVAMDGTGHFSYLYLAGSFVVTAVFVFGLQRKEVNLASIILTLIAFMCPVDISQFTVLKTAQPFSPQLPFAMVRYCEIIWICVWFANYQVRDCVMSTQVTYMEIVANRSGRAERSLFTTSGWRGEVSGNHSIANHTLEPVLQDEDATRWLIYPKHESYGPAGTLDPDLVRVERTFPFNMGALLVIVISFNMFTYLLSCVMARKKTDATPKQLKEMLQGSEITSLTSCCRSNEAEKMRKMGMRTIGLLDDEEDDADEQDTDNLPEHKKAKQEAERVQREQLEKGRDATEALNKLLAAISEGKIDVRQFTDSDTRDKVEKYARANHLEEKLWWTQEPEPEPEPEPEEAEVEAVPASIPASLRHLWPDASAVRGLQPAYAWPSLEALRGTQSGDVSPVSRLRSQTEQNLEERAVALLQARTRSKQRDSQLAQAEREDTSSSMSPAAAAATPFAAAAKAIIAGQGRQPTQRLFSVVPTEQATQDREEDGGTQREHEVAAAVTEGQGASARRGARRRGRPGNSGGSGNLAAPTPGAAKQDVAGRDAAAKPEPETQEPAARPEPGPGGPGPAPRRLQQQQGQARAPSGAVSHARALLARAQAVQAMQDATQATSEPSQRE